MALSDTYLVIQGQETQAQALQMIRSVRIDSYGVWVSLPAFGLVIPPGVVGAIVNLPRAAQMLDISGVTPAGQSAGSGVPGIVTAYARWQTNSPGLAISGYGGGGGGSNVAITSPLGTGTAPAGAVAVDLISPTTLPVSVAGPASALRLNSASGATGVVKAAPGSFEASALINTNAAIRYLHLYNKTTAPTLGTDTPVLTLPFPAGSSDRNNLTGPLAFGTGIAYAVTTDDVAIPAATGAAGDIQGTILFN